MTDSEADKRHAAFLEDLRKVNIDRKQTECRYKISMFKMQRKMYFLSAIGFSMLAGYQLWECWEFYLQGKTVLLIIKFVIYLMMLAAISGFYLIAMKFKKLIACKQETIDTLDELKEFYKDKEDKKP